MAAKKTSTRKPGKVKALSRKVIDAKENATVRGGRRTDWTIGHATSVKFPKLTP